MAIQVKNSFPCGTCKKNRSNIAQNMAPVAAPINAPQAQGFLCQTIQRRVKQTIAQPAPLIAMYKGPPWIGYTVRVSQKRITWRNRNVFHRPSQAMMAKRIFTSIGRRGFITFISGEDREIGERHGNPLLTLRVYQTISIKNSHTPTISTRSQRFSQGEL